MVAVPSKDFAAQDAPVLLRVGAEGHRVAEANLGMTSVESNADAIGPWFVSTVVGGTAGLYLASCLLPTTSVGLVGLFDLVFGWLAGLQGLPAWSANFVLGAGVVCMCRAQFRAAACCGWLAFGLSLTVLTSFKSDEKYVGYYLWLASEGMLAGGASLAWWRGRCQKKVRGRRANLMRKGQITRMKVSVD